MDEIIKNKNIYIQYNTDVVAYQAEIRHSVILLQGRCQPLCALCTDLVAKQAQVQHSAVFL